MHEKRDSDSDSDAETPAPSPTEFRVGPRVLIATCVGSALLAFGLAALLTNIFQRRQEAENPFFRVVEVDDRTQDPAEWGKNFPHQYDAYLRTVDSERTRFGGSEALPRTPTDEDPRAARTRSKIAEDTRLTRLWAGYSFSVDYREKRGHAYMLEDQTYTKRVEVAAQPGTCLTCHASMVVPWMEAGDGDLTAGVERMSAMPWAEARAMVDHPISCIDCHDPETMRLRITRPAFSAGITRAKAAEDIDGYDVEDASRQEMRTYVCAQCHVEYYFEKEGSRLRLPWDRGLDAESILAYYEERQFSDWTHEQTGAPMLKAQHPEFETWSQGTHAAAGVSCVDCHMPYRRVGALKITDHHVRSPMLDVAASCQTCHRVGEDQLRARVERIQARTVALESIALDAIVELMDDIADSEDASADQLERARSHHRRGSFLLDFVLSENSQGFHADQETARVLALALEEVRRGQVSLHESAAPEVPAANTMSSPDPVTP